MTLQSKISTHNSKHNALLRANFHTRSLANKQKNLNNNEISFLAFAKILSNFLSIIYPTSYNYSFTAVRNNYKISLTITPMLSDSPFLSLPISVNLSCFLFCELITQRIITHQMTVIFKARWHWYCSDERINYSIALQDLTPQKHAFRDCINSK